MTTTRSGASSSKRQPSPYLNFLLTEPLDNEDGDRSASSDETFSSVGDNDEDFDYSDDEDIEEIRITKGDDELDGLVAEREEFKNHPSSAPSRISLLFSASHILECPSYYEVPKKVQTKAPDAPKKTVKKVGTQDVVMGKPSDEKSYDGDNDAKVIAANLKKLNLNKKSSSK